MPVYKLAEEMSYEELLGWLVYLDRRPVGWREDERTFKLLQAQGVKGKITEIFPSLRSIYTPTNDNEIKDGIVDVNNLKGSFLFHKMASAIGGDELVL